MFLYFSALSQNLEQDRKREKERENGERGSKKSINAILNMKLI